MMNNFEDPSLLVALEAASTDGASTPTQASDRRAVLQQVFFDSDPTWFWPFLVMLWISSGVASLGLSQNSAATVIGAMIIAPLGSPIVSLGGAIALGWTRETLRMLVFIVLGAAVVVAVGYIIGLLLPAATPTDQLLARTDPDLRDLGVAILAGAAGAYARTRKELSSALVGVAIAVALVPPLCAAGLLLEDGHPLLARGALLLFSANLVGITGAVTVVMFLVGYAPRPRLPRTPLGQVLAIVVLVVAIVVAIPLYESYMLVSGQAVRLATVNRVVKAALGAGNSAVVQGVYLSGDAVEVDLIYAGANFDSNALAQQVTTALGGDTTVTVKTQ